MLEESQRWGAWFKRGLFKPARARRYQVRMQHSHDVRIAVVDQFAPGLPSFQQILFETLFEGAIGFAGFGPRNGMRREGQPFSDAERGKARRC